MTAKHQRSFPQVKKLEDRMGDFIFRVTFNKVNPTWTLPQLLWIRENEPEVLRRTERIFFTKDYLRYRLCGTWETDHIDAQGSMLFDGSNKEWSQDLIQETGLALTVFPPVVKPTTVCGKVTRQAARETGLREGFPVIVGTSDTAAEDYGAGAIEPGHGIVKMATAGNVCMMSARPRPTPAAFNYPHVVEGLWYIVAGTNSCASANRWYRDVLCRWEAEQAKAGGESAFRKMDEMAAGAPLGAGGLFFHPYLVGERSPYFDPYLLSKEERGCENLLVGKNYIQFELIEGYLYQIKKITEINNVIILDCELLLSIDAMKKPYEQIKFKIELTEKINEIKVNSQSYFKPSYVGKVFGK